MEVIRDLLDAPLRDRRYRKMGRVDGLLLDLDREGPPRLWAIEAGPVTLANRLHPRLGAILQRCAKWCGATLEPQRFPMRLISSMDLIITLDVDAKQEPDLLPTEKWLSARLHGAGRR
jgi:hypothetical protein